MATDDNYSDDIPVSTNDPDNDLPEIKENFTWLKWLLFFAGEPVFVGYKTIPTVVAGKITLIEIKDSGDVVKATGTPTYTGDNITKMTWVVDSRTIVYDATYSGDELTSWIFTSIT